MIRFKRASIPDLQRWPVNSTRFLLPSVAVKGFAGHAMRLIVVFWKWRVDFDILPNEYHENQTT